MSVLIAPLIAGGTFVAMSPNVLKLTVVLVSLYTAAVVYNTYQKPTTGNLSSSAFAVFLLGVSITMLIKKQQSDALLGGIKENIKDEYNMVASELAEAKQAIGEQATAEYNNFTWDAFMKPFRHNPDVKWYEPDVKWGPPTMGSDDEDAFFDASDWAPKHSDDEWKTKLEGFQKVSNTWSAHDE